VTSPAWSLDAEAASEALARFKQASRVLMPTHQNVDADGLASPLAMMHALAQCGVEVVPLISDGQLPQSLRFLPGIERVCIYGRDMLPDYDLICLADCSDRRRLGAFYTDDETRIDGPTPIINIDHHVTNDRFGVVNIVEPLAASTAEIVADLLKLWGTQLTAPIAQCLLAGIYGDTLGLRTEATTSRTMRTAADLVDAGANPVPIVDALFRLKPKSTVCLWERALNRIQWTGALIWTELTDDIFASCNAQPDQAEGLVNFLAGTEGSRAAAILYATDTGWRVSLRSLSEEVDVAKIASEFGGGGHPRAAGCTIIGGELEKQVFVRRVGELAAAGTTSQP
jgi:bifunctional oligoribonuclease and PAP phosphatase NrnA